jgi:hypothetical protein
VSEEEDTDEDYWSSSPEANEEDPDGDIRVFL